VVSKIVARIKSAKLIQYSTGRDAGTPGGRGNAAKEGAISTAKERKREEKRGTGGSPKGTQEATTHFLVELIRKKRGKKLAIFRGIGPFSPVGKGSRLTKKAKAPRKRPSRGKQDPQTDLPRHVTPRGRKKKQAPKKEKKRRGRDRREGGKSSRSIDLPPGSETQAPVPQSRKPPHKQKPFKGKSQRGKRKIREDTSEKKIHPLLDPGPILPIRFKKMYPAGTTRKKKGGERGREPSKKGFFDHSVRSHQAHPPQKTPL